MSEQNDLKKTVFYDLHVNNGAKMVEFAGYSMPLHYEMGIKQEHIYCRETVGLFDVSHMGQAELLAEDYETAARALEKIVPGDVLSLKEERLRYSVLLNETGGIEDDLMITHRIQEDGSHVVGLVVNAGRKFHDYAYISSFLPDDVDFKILDDRSLLALQGPEAEKVMAIWCGQSVGMPYMSEIDTTFFDVPCRVSRCGYTGEDGFEISLAKADANRVAEMLLSYPEVELIGLGARDSLRLEAGFCLYGHDIDTATTPIEADLSWIMNKRRRQEGGFLGDNVILEQLANGPAKRRVGLLPDGPAAPAREGAKLFNKAEEEIGMITSGGFGPTIGGPVPWDMSQPLLLSLGQKFLLKLGGESLPGV